MDLSNYLAGLRSDLTAAAAPGGPEVAGAAELLAGSIEASARLALLEALSDAAAEITTKLSTATVEVRLRGREAQFVVTEQPAAERAQEPAPVAPAGAVADGDVARITLRLPESLKEAVERSSAAEGISVNAWLVRAITQIVTQGQLAPATPPTRTGRRISGWAQA
jgi:hypothetical protein